MCCDMQTVKQLLFLLLNLFIFVFLIFILLYMLDKTLRFGLCLLCDSANLRGKRSYKKHFECGYGFITKKT